MAVVSSLFLNDANKKKIDMWIIIVSIALGLLLLLLLTLGLTKVILQIYNVKTEKVWKVRLGFTDVEFGNLKCMISYIIRW